ncbi:C-GCAxxG-C-C family (seleno)protein [Dubosiella newyorkensis]|jgi:C_GCAxxG_C_C family probable redox protein|uniref:C_GCAxxG_C_C family protein n=1 Tax=Dubosiella newyorkensis TaxID=1862672 RepID=A0A1U7NNR6_9FIRM|nr:C-GCAxxG-C-C family (seleno)protein [Dubosiella newyorkensis]MCI9041703.1 hypothetical protein [Dubosiella newyorkensis]OLU46956.1 hypothetical protein BO225_04015 [Dubosiella newyorkensis]
MTLSELAVQEYTNGFNCSESIIRASNDYYDLNLHEEDMKMMAGFGSGMYTGLTCGALSASIAALSKKIIETKAHDQLDEIRPLSQKVVASFNKKLGHTQCAQIKPKHYTKEHKCKETVRLAAQSLEEVLSQEL